MKRRVVKNQPSKTEKRADLILTSDWHLLEKNPICRIDDLVETQWWKVQFIKDLQTSYNCPVIHAGDLFDKWKPSPWLLTMTMVFMPKMFYTVLGNHDLPQHNIDNVFKSGVRTLIEAGKILMDIGIGKGNWGQEPDDIKLFNRRIAVLHKQVYRGKKPYGWSGGTPAIKFLMQYPQFDLIVTGDNHKPFVEECEGRLLVNPGSLLRLEADQIDHKPRIYLWDAGTNTVECVYIPIKKGVVSNEHLIVKKQREDRIEAFIKMLDTDWDTSLSFERNMQLFFENNRLRKKVKELILKVMSDDE